MHMAQCMHTHMHKIPNSFGGISEVRGCVSVPTVILGASLFLGCWPVQCSQTIQDEQSRTPEWLSE